MAIGNIAPIFPGLPVSSFGKLITANTAMDGTGSNVVLLFTADATYGSRVDRVIARALGTNVQSVIRFWLNNGATVATATNNSLLDELLLPASTGANDKEVGGAEKFVGWNLAPGYRIYGAVGTTGANGWQVALLGGSYAP